MEKFAGVSRAGPCTRALGRTRIVFEGIVYRLIQIGRAATAADGDGEWLRLRGTAERLRRRLGMTLERCGSGACQVRARRCRPRRSVSGAKPSEARIYPWLNGVTAP